MMNWKKLFDEDRLDRGYNYYLEGKVYDVILTDNSIISKVEGSKSNIYEVKITFDDENGIESLYCTCPYSYADFNCKHMVATLYKKEEISNHTKSNIEDNNYVITTKFADLIKSIDENKLRRYLYDKFINDEDFMEEFINQFQNDFGPEDFDNYENMLDNIFNIDVVELYNENGFYQEAPFNRYLESFINNKISLLYKNKEYNYVLQLLYMIYENISKKANVNQYIEVDEILKNCNYYVEKVIEAQDQTENEEVFTYLINELKYNYNSKTSKYLMELCLNNFTKKIYLRQLDNALDEIMENDDVCEEILISKYELMKLLEYPVQERKNYLEEHKNKEKISSIIIDMHIKNKEIDEAIELLKYNQQIHGKTYSLEDTTLLLSLYVYKNDNANAICVLKNILYNFNIKDMYFVRQLKELCSPDKWLDEKKELISFYEDSYAYDFLNEVYVEEADYDLLFKNIVNNCRIQKIEDYREYIEDDYSDEIISIYKKYVLEEAKTSKNVSGYTLIIRFLDLMISYPDSINTVRNVVDTLKNKYKVRKVFMEMLEEFEILNSL